MNEEKKLAQVLALRLTVLVLGDRLVFWIAVDSRGLIAIAPSVDPDVDVRLGYIIQAKIERTLVGGGVVFHPSDVQARLLETCKYRLPIILQVFVGRGKVDPHSLHDSRLRTEGG